MGWRALHPTARSWLEESGQLETASDMRACMVGGLLKLIKGKQGCSPTFALEKDSQ